MISSAAREMYSGPILMSVLLPDFPVRLPQRCTPGFGRGSPAEYS
jgi:hypothetical protein